MVKKSSKSKGKPMMPGGHMMTEKQMTQMMKEKHTKKRK